MNIQDNDLKKIKGYSFTKKNNELKIEYVIGGDIGYNFNFLRILINSLIYILIFIGGLVSCCLSYTYASEQLHNDSLGMLLIVISIALQIFLFIAFYNYNKNLRKGNFIITPSGIDVNFKYFDKKINIPKNIIDKCSYRNDLMQLIISLKENLSLEIDGNKKFGFIKTGILLDKQKAIILKDEINNILSKNVSKIENQNITNDNFSENLDLPDSYIYKETDDGFIFEGEIPSGNFGNNTIASIFIISSFIFFVIFILIALLNTSLDVKIFNNNTFLLVFPVLFLVCLFTGILLSSDIVNPSNKLRKMSVNNDGITVDFKYIKNGKQKESIKISKNDISQIEIVKIRHRTRKYSYYNTYNLYFIGKNKIFIEKNRYLSKIFTGLSFRSEYTAQKIKEKFESVWQIH